MFEYLAFKILLHTKSEQKVVGHWFCAQIILISDKNRVFNKKYDFTISVMRVWIVIFCIRKKTPWENSSLKQNILVKEFFSYIKFNFSFAKCP